MTDLHNLALRAGAAYWVEPGAEKPTYLLSVEELHMFLVLFLAEQEARFLDSGSLQ